MYFPDSHFWSLGRLTLCTPAPERHPEVFKICSGLWGL